MKVCSDTLVQRFIPDDHLGRVFALFDMIVNVCLVAGIALMALVSPTSGQAPWSTPRSACCSWARLRGIGATVPVESASTA